MKRIIQSILVFMLSLVGFGMGFFALAADNAHVDYTTDDYGTYPSNTWQPTDQENILNHQGYDSSGWDGKDSWDGDPNNTIDSYLKFGSDTEDPEYAIRKYARETNTPGLYDVYLNVKGNSNSESSIEPVDIVLVVDMSGSMAGSRMTSMRNGIRDFMTTIQDAGMGDYVNLGLVTYSNGVKNTIAIDKVSNSSHRTDINNALAATPSGSTFTQDAIRAGSTLLENHNSENKEVMVLLTDGVPTTAYYITEFEEIDGIIYGTKFSNNAHTSGDTSQIMVYDGGNTTPSSYKINGTSQTIKDMWPATVGEARLAREKGIEIHTLGIQIGNDISTTIYYRPDLDPVNPTIKYPSTYLTAAQVQERMKRIPSSPELYQEAKTDQAIEEYLSSFAEDLIHSINTNSIVDGSIEDPIGEQFIYATEEASVRSVGDKEVDEANLPNIEINNGTLSADKLNLGADQEVQIHYQIRINTETDSFVPDRWYQMNGQTTLTPNGSKTEDKVEFGVPSAKAPGVKLNLKKIWDEYDNDESSRPNYLDFKVKRETIRSSSGWEEAYLRITADEDWYKQDVERLSKERGENYEAALYLPKFNNSGENFSYTVEEEMNVPDGYEVISNEEGTEWTNTKIFVPYGLIIKKTSDKDEDIFLQGAEFKLTGGSLPEEGIMLIDNGDGTYTLPEGDEYRLDKGKKYTLIEATPPTGYKPSEKTWIIEIDETGEVIIDGEPAVVEDSDITYTVENEFIERPLFIEKYNSEDGSKLNNAKFTLKQYENGNFETVIANKEMEGNVTEEKLDPGYYSLQETSVPDGFELDDEIFYFQIDINGKLMDREDNEIENTIKPELDGFYVNDEDKIILVKYNDLKDFDFSIIKKDAHSGKKLAGAEFSLATEEDPDNILATLTTDEEGKGQFKDEAGEIYIIRPGIYIVKEMKAPEDYVILEGIFKMVVSANGTVTVTYDDKDINPDEVVIDMSTYGNNIIELTVANAPKGWLPATGGAGIHVFFITSVVILIVLGAVSIYYVYRNRKGLN